MAISAVKGFVESIEATGKTAECNVIAAEDVARIPKAECVEPFQRPRDILGAARIEDILFEIERMAVLGDVLRPLLPCYVTLL